MNRQLFRMSSLIVFAGIVSSTLLVMAQGKAETEAGVIEHPTEQVLFTEVTVEAITDVPVVQEMEAEEITSSTYPKFSYSKDWDYEDTYLLAKIAMAEAEGENVQTKTLVILTVLNRVWSEEFPNTIEEVIFESHQNSNGKTVYQFSPVIPGGRWWTTEPNEECYEAVEVVRTALYDYSGGALYFESSEYDSWHSRNLEFLYQSENMKFYK